MKIDTKKQPKIPYENWTIESHDTSLGEIDLAKIELYLDDAQKDGKYIEGNKLREKLKDKPVLNATVLDYLYEHQELIPDSWKGKHIFFWGTIYRSSFGDLCVRYFYFLDGSWGRLYGWLGNDWYGRNPAAVAGSTLGTKKLSPKPSDPLDGSVLEINGDRYKLSKIN